MAIRQIFNAIFLLSRGALNIITFVADRRAKKGDSASSTVEKERSFYAKLASKAAEATASFPERRSELGPEIGRAMSGHQLTFEYADEDGVLSIRFVTHWIEHRRHVRGWCTTRHAHRTFRKDRVQDWISGHNALKYG